MKFLPVLLMLCLSVPLAAYDNDKRDTAGAGLIAGGPHRTINELALGQWLKTCTDSTVKRYQLLDDYQMLGPTVVAPGMELATTEDRRGNLRWWVSEGGYDADEPELYASFRHFYDPRSLDGVPHLTDHLETLNFVYRVFIFGTKTGRVVGVVLGNDFNPRVNARDWAISGERNNGWDDNAYCWNRGRDYLAAAFAATDAQQKQRLFTQAWRALGETMHLMGDMTCVPHVRNTSHPGKAIGYKFIGNTDPNLGYLRNDPYELYCTEDVIRRFAGSSLDPLAKGAVDGAADIRALFHQVSLYTQEHFFSANTIGGSFVKNKGKPNQREIRLRPANGKGSYPFPVLKACDYSDRTGLFSTIINGKRVRMGVESWMSSMGWGDPEIQGPEVSRACVLDQADILVPVALYANAKLVDWFVPRLELQIAQIDPGAKTLAATLTHRPYGAYTAPLVYTASLGQEYRLWVNGALQPHGAFALTLAKNAVSGTLPGAALKKGDKVVLGVGIGGLLVKSPEYEISGTNGAAGAGGWVLDGTVATPMHRVEDDPRNFQHTEYDAVVNNGGGSTRYHRVFTGVNKFDYTHQYTHSWTVPPNRLTPGEALTLTVAAADNGSKGTGDATFYHDRWGETMMHCALVTPRAVVERMKQQGRQVLDTTCINIGDTAAKAWADLERPTEGKSQDQQTKTITIPGREFGQELELVISFSIKCNNVDGSMLYYYRWDGPAPPPVDPGDIGCVAAGTQVTREDGTRAAIESLRPGDRIAAFDQQRQAPGTATILQLLVHAAGPYAVQRLSLQDGQTLLVTGNHPVYTTAGEWVPVERLQPGAGVYFYDPQTGALRTTTVLSIVRDQGVRDTVYNLRTSLGDYYANDLLVHNKCLAAGSLVDTPAGPCPVERLRVGQLVYGRQNGRRVITPVTHLYLKATVLPALPGVRLTPRVTATVNHRVWDGARFLPAGARVRERVSIAGPVYDLQTAVGAYYADGLLMTADE